jgi:hypothetical protein
MLKAQAHSRQISGSLEIGQVHVLFPYLLAKQHGFEIFSWSAFNATEYNGTVQWHLNITQFRGLNTRKDGGTISECSSV